MSFLHRLEQSQNQTVHDDSLNIVHVNKLQANKIHSTSNIQLPCQILQKDSSNIAHVNIHHLYLHAYSIYQTKPFTMIFPADIHYLQLCAKDNNYRPQQPLKYTTTKDPNSSPKTAKTRNTQYEYTLACSCESPNSITQILAMYPTSIPSNYQNGAKLQKVHSRCCNNIPSKQSVHRLFFYFSTHYFHFILCGISRNIATGNGETAAIS